MFSECLNCTLPICDDRSKKCAYRLVQIQSRKEYYAAYYKANRERKLAAANQRYVEKHDEIRAYQAGYKQRTARA